MAGIVLSTVLELSYQSDDGIRFKADFFWCMAGINLILVLV
jgi:hypothetical protein